MASESYFRGTFCSEIIAAYSKERFTNARMQSVWAAVKSFSDEALAAALKEITKPAMFPGADKIIEACAIANAALKADEIARAKASGECSFCSGGLRQVNGYAYRCSCKIGQLTYPNIPQYDGQPEWTDKFFIEDGYEVTETQTHIYRRKIGSRDIRDCSFSIKAAPAYSKPKSDFKPKLIKAEHYNSENF